MPYDPITGEYKEEDASVSKKLTGLIAKDNPYMQAAATRGAQDANRRGLLNTSIATGAVEAARINAALPIASQEAGQSHQSNLQGRNIQMTDIGQKRDIGATREFLGTEIASREDMQAADIASREGMQGRDITSREGLVARDISSREGMQQLDIDSRERIANMNISANDRIGATSMSQNIDANYNNLVANIMKNPDIPASERQRYLDHAANIRDSGYNLLEQFFGVDLQWTTPGTTGGTPRNAQPVPYYPGNFGRLQR